MKTLRKAPLFKLILCFVLGIILASRSYVWPIYAGIISVPITLICIWKDQRLTGWYAEYLSAASIYIVTLGMGTYLHYTQSKTPGLSTHYINCRTVKLEGLIISKVKKNQWNKKAWIEVRQIFLDNKWVPISGKLQIQVKLSDSTNIQLHHFVRVEANISNIRSPYPSYLDYLYKNGIYYTAYVKQVEVLKMSQSLSSHFTQMQIYFSHKLSILIPDPNLSGIARAMFLGDKMALQKESREIFAHVGASHILAISGLHIGMIYLLLSWLFQFLHLLAHGKRIKNLIILGILLIYTCLTGASPAVIRAVCMYGFILLFKICYQRYHILNILAVSAFVQILWNSAIVFHIGFQLSYLAVTGIIVLFPIFEEQFPVDHFLLKKVYACIGVTICATLATAPLVMIYFGQFPTYFLLTNLLITAITGGTVFAGFVTVMCISIPFVNQICGWVSFGMLTLLYTICDRVASLPHTLITELRWDDPGVYILLAQLVIAWIILIIPSKIRGKLTQPIQYRPVLQKAG